MTPKLWPARIWWVCPTDIVPSLSKVPEWTPEWRCLACPWAFVAHVLCPRTISSSCKQSEPHAALLTPWTFPSGPAADIPTLYFSRRWGLREAYTCPREGGLIAVSRQVSTHSASAHRTLWSREKSHQIFFFFKLAYGFSKSNLSGPRSAFLSTMKVHIMFSCGMQAATIFKLWSHCTCHPRPVWETWKHPAGTLVAALGAWRTRHRTEECFCGDGESDTMVKFVAPSLVEVLRRGFSPRSDPPSGWQFSSVHWENVGSHVPLDRIGVWIFASHQREVFCRVTEVSSEWEGWFKSLTRL